MAPPQLKLFPFGAAERPALPLALSGAHQQAWERLTVEGGWAGGAMALVGAVQTGKTTLARAWAERVGAHRLSPRATLQEGLAAFEAGRGRLWLDDLHDGMDDGMLFVVLDLARAQAGAVLLSGRGTPREWRAQSPDLASRLAAMAVARVEPPDQALLGAVLREALRAHYLELSAEAADFLALRMERSFAAAHAVAAELARAIDQRLAPANKAITAAALVKLFAAAPGLAAALGVSEQEDEDAAAPTEAPCEANP